MEVEIRGKRRLLITGGAGYLGRAIAAAAGVAGTGWDVHVTQRRAPAPCGSAHRCDLSDADSVRSLLSRVEPELVIHTAYGTQAMESDIGDATRNLVDGCLATGSRLIHLSSDLVLDGEHAPYTEEAEPAPVHEYGRWKARAERYVRERMPEAAVVRASLITCFDPPDPRTAWVIGGLRGDEDVTLFTDEIRSPILVGDLTAQILEIATLDPSTVGGVWHLAAPEALSRFAIGALAATAVGLPADRLRGGLGSGAAAGGGEPRPRDVRLLTARADARLTHRPRTLSAAAADALASRMRVGYHPAS